MEKYLCIWEKSRNFASSKENDTTKNYTIMKQITLEEFINLIRKACDVNPILRASILENPTETEIEYRKNGEISHIWLHGYRTKGYLPCGNHESHRVAYESVKDTYMLRHYIWIDKRGWVLVGNMNTTFTEHYSVKKLW